MDLYYTWFRTGSCSRSVAGLVVAGSGLALGRGSMRLHGDVGGQHPRPLEREYSSSFPMRVKLCYGVNVFFSRGLLIFYLGFLMKEVASSRPKISGMKSSLQIFMRSQWAFLGSAVIPTSDASGSSPNRDGTGPAMTSPSNRAASAGQELMRMTGMLSLKIRIVFIAYNYIFIKFK